MGRDKRVTNFLPCDEDRSVELAELGHEPSAKSNTLSASVVEPLFCWKTRPGLLRHAQEAAAACVQERPMTLTHELDRQIDQSTGDADGHCVRHLPIELLGRKLQGLFGKVDSERALREHGRSKDSSDTALEERRSRDDRIEFMEHNISLRRLEQQLVD